MTAPTPTAPRQVAPLLVEPDLWVVPVPLYVRMEPVNAWILRDDEGGLTLFDTGIAAGADACWTQALAAIGHDPGDVRRVIVSHHHPDHIGGAGALHRLTGCGLHASASTIEQAPDVWGDDGRFDSYFAALSLHLAQHGVPDQVTAALAPEHGLARMAVELPPDHAWRPLHEGDELTAAGRTWRVHLTPGHADGHLVLHAPHTGTLLAADHLLERVSPAVGRFPRHHPDPLGNYLASLERVRELHVERVLPGHGDPFGGAARRAQQLVEHHVERMRQCVDAVQAIGSASAYEVAGRVFERVFRSEQLDAPNQRFATTESLAHLERVRFEGRLARELGDDGVLRYRVVRS